MGKDCHMENRQEALSREIVFLCRTKYIGETARSGNTAGEGKLFLFRSVGDAVSFLLLNLSRIFTFKVLFPDRFRFLYLILFFGRFWISRADVLSFEAEKFLDGKVIACS